MVPLGVAAITYAHAVGLSCLLNVCLGSRGYASVSTETDPNLGLEAFMGNFLGLGYYANKDFSKAKKWLMFLTRCSSIELGNEKEFLIDLREPDPEGDLHLIGEKEIMDRYYDRVTSKRLKNC